MDIEKKVNLFQGDCFEKMKDIPNKSVDLILCDLPYGVTNNKKDVSIDLNLLWKQYKRILQERGIVVLTSQFPFTFELISSNKEWFKYDLIWDKILTSGFLNANKMPLRSHEHILIFYNKKGTYNPQKVLGSKSHSKGKMKTDKNINYGEYTKVDNTEALGNMKHPKSIISFMKPHPSTVLHATEKPVKLMEWLINTYSNINDVVLDNCMGSGTTGVACYNLDRRFIGIELSEEYFKIAEKRIKEVTEQSKLISHC